MPVPSLDALARLKAGNERFAATGRGAENRSTDGSVHEPFAVVLGCSDARVPPEIVFDQGAGDLFVVRVAGNVAAPEQVESIEFAVTGLGARLVVVLGHSRCGAVAAAVEAMRTNVEPASLRAIIDRIRPSVADVLGRAPDDDLLLEAVRANVRATVTQLERSPVLAAEIERGDLLVCGALYSVEDRVVVYEQA